MSPGWESVDDSVQGAQLLSQLFRGWCIIGMVVYKNLMRVIDPSLEVILNTACCKIPYLYSPLNYRSAFYPLLARTEVSCPHLGFHILKVYDEVNNW